MLLAVVARAEEPQLTPVLIEVEAPLRLLPGADGDRHLVYELRLSNITPGEATFREVQVIDAGRGTTIAELDAGAIAGRLGQGGRRDFQGTTLGGSQFGLLFVHVVLPSDAPVPDSLRHVVLADLAVVGEGLEIGSAPVPVEAFDPPVLGPPLIGAGYVAADGCCDSIRHVRAALPIDGRLHLAQRYAIDWERVDADRRLVAGDLSDPASYTIYGEDVLAVADGEVVAAVDRFADQVPGDLPAGLPFDEADGNHVILHIAEGVYVLYAHLKPGSVAVAAGETVTRGQVIGQVGNTGNTTAPHLHLHVMDGPSALDSDGLPYVFDRFAVTATNPSGTEDFDRAEATGSRLALEPVDPPAVHRGLMPMDQWVVDWMNAGG